MAFTYLGNPYTEQKTMTDYMQANDESALKQKLGNAQSGLYDEKAKKEKLDRASQYLGMATPDNWQAIRQQAIGEGLGNEQTIPQVYDPKWIKQTQAAFVSHQSDTPSAIQEYGFYNALGTPEEKQTYMDVKRANPYLNLGNKMVQPAQDGTIKNSFDKAPPPEDMPDFKADVKGAEKTAELNATRDSDVTKSLAEIQSFDDSVKRFRTAIASTKMTGPIGGRFGNITADAGRTNLVSAQNELTLRAKSLLGMPSQNFSDADRDFISEIAGGKYGSAEGLGKVADRLEQLSKTQSENLRGQRSGDFRLDSRIPAQSSPPPGKLIGTSGGKAVYELPDGSHVMEQ